MSLRYKGAVISATPPTTTGGESGVASGSWTLEQQLQAQGAGNWPEPFVAKYIEDVFSTYLYTGNGSTQTITNGIDLSTKGGLVWLKNRNVNGYGNLLFDTVRGADKGLQSETTSAQFTLSGGLTSFGASGFTLGGAYPDINGSSNTFASWTFRKQPKFFDVVTYTGNETAGKTVNHSLGSDPGCIIIKRLSPSGYNWFVYHRSNPTKYTNLNLTNAETNFTIVTSVSSTNFTLPADASTNANGIDYVAYLFAHNAGGFGLTGTDNVISCGSFTADGSGNATVNLGYEPQWVMMKRTDGAVNWIIFDIMRGWTVGGTDSVLFPNTSSDESDAQRGNPTATGFQFSIASQNDSTWIYIAIRRGPMKVPTSGTSVFAVNATTGNGSGNTLTTNFPVDLSIDKGRTTGPAYWIDRLRGGAQYIDSASTNAEATYASTLINFQSNTSIVDANYGSTINTYVDWAFGRAPSFFDEVCYTGDGASTRTLSHNLAVAPEWIILRKRNSSGYWFTYFNFGSTSCAIAQLEDTGAASTSDYSGLFSKMGGAPTSSNFFVTNPAFGETNLSGTTYVAYLFATCAGVSKVGSYTGNGSTQTINCGFTGGARFVLIKRTDSTGDWYVYDTARGMTTLTDPYLLLNSTAAESVTLGSVTTVSTGFAVNASILAAINTNGASYIFLAIA